MKTLTVVGATGQLAVPVINRLSEKGVQVKAVVRNVDKAKQCLPEGTDIVYADVQDIDSLKKAFEGSEYIYINLSTTTLRQDLPFYQEREGVKNIVEAASNHQVKQILQIAGIESLRKDFAIGGLPLKTSLIREQGMEYIQKSGIAYTFFYCSFFLDSFPLYLQDNVFGIIGDLKYPLYFTNTTDFAENIFNAIGNQKAFNKAYAVQGKEGLAFHQAAKRFISGYAPEAEIQNFPISAIKMMGLSDEQAEFMEHIMVFVEQLKEEFVAEQTWKELGEPKTSIEDFAKSIAYTDCQSF